MANERMYRSFEREIGVAARVLVQTGAGEEYPEIDEATGLIGLQQTFKGTSSADEAWKKGAPRSFTLQLVKDAGDERCVITQRAHGDRYLKTAASSEVAGDLAVYSFPPCQVKARVRSGTEMQRLGVKESLAVWCNTMQSESGSNRADIWRVSEFGKVKLFQIFAVTLDGGETFQLIGETRWEGKIYRRARPGPYVPKSDDQRVTAVLGSDRVVHLGFEKAHIKIRRRIVGGAF